MFQPIPEEEKGAGPPARNLGVQLQRGLQADTGETGKLGRGTGEWEAPEGWTTSVMTLPVLLMTLSLAFFDFISAPI